MAQLSSYARRAISKTDRPAWHCKKDAALQPGPTFSPDGSQIYGVRSDEKDPFFKYLYSIPVLGGKARKLISDVDSPVSFSPDGRQFVYEHCLQPKNDIEVKLADVNGSGERLLAILHEASGFLSSPVQVGQPDGQTIAVPALQFGTQRLWSLFSISVTEGSVRKLFEPRLDRATRLVTRRRDLDLSAWRAIMDNVIPERGGETTDA